MRRWILKKNAKSLDDLVMEETVIPVPQKGEVRVKVYAVSLNYRDVAMANGKMGIGTNRDFIPACDGVGEIDAIGDEVTGWKLGDKVVSLYFREWFDGPPVPGLGIGLGSDEGDGMLAEYVILKSDQIIFAPKSLNYIEASTLTCAGLTAWSALKGNRPYINPLKEGEKVLVLGTGSVAMMVISIAKGLGAEIYCTTSQDDKIEILKNLGATEVLNYKKQPNWGQSIFEMTGGIDLVVNTAGTASIDESFKALAYGGRTALVGAMDSTDKFPNLLMMIYKNLSMFGVLPGSTAAFNDFNNFLDEELIKPFIYQIFDFANTKEAYQLASSATTLGKVVIKIQ